MSMKLVSFVEAILIAKVFFSAPPALASIVGYQ